MELLEVLEETIIIYLQAPVDILISRNIRSKKKALRREKKGKDKMMNIIYIKGLSVEQISRIASGKKTTEEIAYAQIWSVCFIPYKDDDSIILFSGAKSWSQSFDGDSNDFLKFLAG